MAYNINTLENYLTWEQWLRDNGYHPWQYQYSWNSPEGLHVWFMKAGEPDIEIVTRSEEVQKAILKFKPAD
jgi:hypothetical protein